MPYRGDIIEESLSDKSVLKELRIVATRIELITPDHKTPWLKQWTLHTVNVPDEEAEIVADKISHSLDRNYWYADFKNETTHWIIFPNRVFKVDRAKPQQYKPVVTHGLELNIPRYQLDFSPEIQQRERLE